VVGSDVSFQTDYLTCLRDAMGNMRSVPSSCPIVLGQFGPISLKVRGEGGANGLNRSTKHRRVFSSLGRSTYEMVVEKYIRVFDLA
jgi:hypothetical protein